MMIADDIIMTVRIRASAPDPFQGLRGHAYIKARGLAPRISPICQTHDGNGERPNWRDMTDEAIQLLLESSPDSER